MIDVRCIVDFDCAAGMDGSSHYCHAESIIFPPAQRQVGKRFHVSVCVQESAVRVEEAASRWAERWVATLLLAAFPLFCATISYLRAPSLVRMHSPA